MGCSYILLCARWVDLPDHQTLGNSALQYNRCSFLCDSAWISEQDNLLLHSSHNNISPPHAKVKFPCVWFPFAHLHYMLLSSKQFMKLESDSCDRSLIK